MAEQHVTIQSPHPDWSSEDAANLRQFLKTSSGGKLLGMLAQLRPGLFALSVEAAALEGKVVAGWEACTDLILRAGLLKPTAEVLEPVAYPDLDSDGGWSPDLHMPPDVPPEVVTPSADIEKPKQ